MTDKLRQFWTALQAAGRDPETYQDQLDDPVDEQIAELKSWGASNSSVASNMKINRSTVVEHLKRPEVQRRITAKVEDHIRACQEMMALGVDKAFYTMLKVMEQVETNPNVALQAAVRMLQGTGILRDLHEIKGEVGIDAGALRRMFAGAQVQNQTTEPAAEPVNNPVVEPVQDPVAEPVGNQAGDHGS